MSEQARPAMRRKSSAQNLLSSFKSGSPSIPAPVGAGSLSSATGLAMASVVTQTSTTAVSTSLPRDLDAQSLHSDGVSNSLVGAGSPAVAQGASVDILRDLVHKRIITLTYIRSIHEGRSHWFHTIMISRADLDKTFNNSDMRRRSLRFTMLGMSLSNLLDMNSPQDLLRGLTNIMNEYDQSKEDNDKSKMRSTKRFIWKNAKNSEGGSDGSYLMSMHIPFVLDYHETLLSLLDVMSEVYNKISKLLGPSAFPQSQHYMGPLGPLSPHPGVSYLFPESSASQNPGANPTQNPASAQFGDTDVDSSLWRIANSSNIGTGPAIGTSSHGSALANSQMGNWSGSWGDMVIKADNKIKKITTSLLKDLDQLARNGIREEFASLDPLLRNLTSFDDPPLTANGKFGTEFDIAW